MSHNNRCQAELTTFFRSSPSTAIPPRCAHTHPQQQNQQQRQSRFGECPICGRSFALHVLPSHAESCHGIGDDCSDGRAETPDPTVLKATESESESESGRFAACPICQDSFPLHSLPSHAEFCGGRDTGNCGEVNSPKLPLRTCTDTMSEKGRKRNCDELTPTQSNNDWWKRHFQRDKDEGAVQVQKPVIEHDSEPLPGLFLYENFISAKEEEMILSSLDCRSARNGERYLPWKRANFNGPHFGKRWGVHCNLRDRRVNAQEDPLPPFISELLLPRLRRVIPMLGCTPNEANAIDYRRKLRHFLTSHVDDRQLSKEPIANLSLAGDCYMTFRNEKMKDGRASFPGPINRDSSFVMEKQVLLKKRTLQILTGKARYDYSHGIRNEDLLSDRRVSLTMRESPVTKNKP